MHLVIVTPEGIRADQQVSEVNVPGSAGDLGILPGHRALITSLGIGKLSYVAGATTEYLAVNEGYMTVADNELIVVTETAEGPDDIDVPRAERSLAEADKLLGELEGRKEAYDQAMAKKRRAENRIALAKAHATPDVLKK